ncbi:peptidase family M3-domain-containing protein [Cercophora newfieldiana]|uniref:Peptidase family M3-domain-containing protein n=1 Tax=Cercophora newfieldiana TaxID=92897 RepID=A0AA40CKQ8_9PEZI|nr:peptidase family M3-domain-containing protein [Cercophora newfieldiana]
MEHDENLWWSAIEPDTYRMLAPDLERRQAGVEAQKIASRFNIECSMRDDVFRLVDAVFQMGNDTLDPESWRVVEVERRRCVQRHGMDLPPGPARDRYRAISERLSELQLEYKEAIDQESGGIWFTSEELDGVTQEVIDKLEKGTTLDNAGKLRVSFMHSDVSNLLVYARNPETRKRYWVAHENRCSENIPRFREIMKLRHEAARLLGYPNHAAKRLEERMAKTPETVIAFLDDLRSRISRRAREEAGELLGVKEKDLMALGIPFDGNIYIWDLSYYSRSRAKKKYNVDPLKAAEYFPLDKTVSGLLGIFGHLLGLVFVELATEEERGKASPTGKADDILWHESVTLYAVWDDDANGAKGDPGFVGYLYLDVHPRPGKHERALCATIRSGYQYPDGTRCYPATCLVASLGSADSQPTLLRHRQLVTLFHELGHCMHDLVSRTTYSRFHGVSVARDFIEAPSQMLENWCWIPSCLTALSSHYETGEQIPQDMLEALIDANREDALDMLSQLGHAALDMEVHTFPMHEKEPDYTEMYTAVYREVTGIKGFEALGKQSEWNHGYSCSTGLITSNDAGYYGYLWSKVYSTDMFYTAFKDDPMNKEAGRRYRHVLLEKGGSQDEMLTLEQFLGRKPLSEPFFRDLGWM